MSDLIKDIALTDMLSEGVSIEVFSLEDTILEFSREEIDNTDI